MLLAVIMVLSVIAACQVSAATLTSTEIKKGTPVIDGLFDQIYNQSAYYQMEDDDLGAVYDTFGGDPSARANAYFLWDENYFYMCVFVEDDDVLSIGQDRIEELRAQSINAAWANDAVESWFVIDDEYIMKVHTDAFGLNVYANAEGSDYTPEVRFDMENSIVIATPLGDGYFIEAAFKPLVPFTAGMKLNYCMQLNDIQDVEASTVQCSGSQKPGEMPTLTLSAEEVVVPVEEEPAAEEPAAEDGSETGAAPETPVTADAGIVCAAVVMAAAAGFVLTRKHR